MDLRKGNKQKAVEGKCLVPPYQYPSMAAKLPAPSNTRLLERVTASEEEAEVRIP